MSDRFDVRLIDTPNLDWIVERMATLQRYGLSVRQRRALGALYGRMINAQLERVQPDIVVSIGASHKLIRIDAKWPLIHVSDGFFGTMVGYYQKFGRFSPYVVRASHRDFQHFIDKVDLTLFASDWARDSAETLYEIGPGRTRVVPFGANLDQDPGYRPRRLDGPLTLLFVGYDWQRKGGDIALEAWRELRRRTGDAEFHIVGCTPKAARGLDGVFLHGRLNKSDPEDFALLGRLYDSASLFFMPSREEAFGMVFCEASAYGVPSVSTITGGIPTVIIDGETGLLLPLDAAPHDYVQPILDLWADKERFAAFSHAARHRYETALSWPAWGGEMERAVLDILS